MVRRVVIAGLEVIEARFGIVIVATVAQRVDAGHAAGDRQVIAPSVIGIGRNGSAGSSHELHYIAL